MYDSDGMDKGIDRNTRSHVLDWRPQPVQDSCCQEIQWCMETKEILSVD